MVWFNESAGPGWHDYLGLLLSVVGFSFAIVQLRKSRNATTAATDALEQAQHDVARMAFMSIIPQVQTVVDDLSYAMPVNDREVARRALVRFSILGGEVSEILAAVDGDHSALRISLAKTSSKATKVKGTLVIERAPDLIALVKTVSSEIDVIHQQLAKVGAQMRNRIEGVPDVQ